MSTYNLMLYELLDGNVLGKCCGVLNPVRNDVVTEVLNGKYELTFQYPLKGDLISRILVESVVCAPVGNEEWDYFLVYRMSKALQGWVTVHCRQISCLLSRHVCLPFTASEPMEVVEAMMANTVDGCTFYLSSDMEWDTDMTAYPMVVTVPTTLSTLMGSGKGCVRDLFGGEWKYRKFNAKLVKTRGKNRGMRIRYGFNMTELQADYDAHAVPDGYYAYIREDSPVGFQSCVVTRIGYGQRKGAWLEPKDYTETLSEVLTAEDAESVWLEKLHDYAQIDVYNLGSTLSDQGGSNKQRWLPSFRVGFEMLSKTEEYKDAVLPDEIELGDLVEVVFEDANVLETLRVTEVQYCPTQDKYVSIVVGPPRRSIINTIMKK